MKKIKKIIKESFEEADNFDATEFMTSAKKAFLQDLAKTGEEFKEIGQSKFEKSSSLKDIISAAERANLNLQSDIEKLKKIEKDVEKSKKTRDINKMNKMAGKWSIN